MINALMRALMAAMLVALPALSLPQSEADGTQIVVLIAIFIALLVFLEYNSAYPSFVEFRYAPPINRLRFAGLAISVVVLTALCADKTGASTLNALFAAIARLVSGWLDFPFSPVRLLTLVLPPDAPQTLLNTLRAAAGFAYFVSLVMVGLFLLLVWIMGWPSRNGAFNVWVNLPLFDPTAGGDVVRRLQFHARLNLMLGFLLPFLIPALASVVSGLFDPMMLARPQNMVWVVSLWAIVPASLMIRGLALGRVAEMIQQKRNRAYAAAEAEGVQLV